MIAKTRSIRLRLLAYAAAVVILAMVLTGVGLTALFERYAERRVGQELDTYLSQIAGALRFDADGSPRLARHPSDPRFDKVFGGLYWQINKAGQDVVLRSRSLWDSVLELPSDTLLPGETHSHSLPGPTGAEVLTHETAIIVATTQGDVQMNLAVAIDTHELELLTAGFRGDMIPALGLLGLVLLVGFYVQISAGLRPMQALRQEIAAIRDGRQERLTGPVPREVAPLVEEVNALLDLQEQDMARARDRAADLAHGLKTPLTALASDVARLRDKGETELAAEIEELAARMRRHLDREMVRARYRHSRTAPPVALSPTVKALVRTLERTPDGKCRTYSQDVPDDLKLTVDPDDLNDVFGNLLENATRHATAQVRISAERRGGRALITVQDDGPGLSDDQIATVTKRGQRLDTTGSGAGLGLAIVAEIVDANAGSISFARSSLGGLSVTCDLPASV
jgi:signal transduction histidine kinase